MKDTNLSTVIKRKLTPVNKIKVPNWCQTYSLLSNKRGGWNKRGGVTKF